MCGRFSLKTPVEQLAKQFKTSSAPKLAPRCNVAPSQEVLTVVNKGYDREFGLTLWGLIPSWSKEPRGIINARRDHP